MNTHIIVTNDIENDNNREIAILISKGIPNHIIWLRRSCLCYLSTSLL
jgi:hypothetical protein